MHPRAKAFLENSVLDRRGLAVPKYLFSVPQHPLQGLSLTYKSLYYLSAKGFEDQLRTFYGLQNLT